MSAAKPHVAISVISQQKARPISSGKLLDWCDIFWTQLTLKVSFLSFFSFPHLKDTLLVFLKTECKVKNKSHFIPPQSLIFPVMFVLTVINNKGRTPLSTPRSSIGKSIHSFFGGRARGNREKARELKRENIKESNKEREKGTERKGQRHGE